MAVGDRINNNGDGLFTAPTGGVTRGKIYKIGDKQVVARQTVDAAATFLGAHWGDVEVTKAAGTGKTFALGAKVYALSNVAALNATGAVLIGYATKAAAATDTVVEVKLTAAEIA